MNETLNKVLGEKIADLQEQKLFRDLKVIESAQGPRVIIAGKEVINLSSNNYLGLATHPKMVEKAVEATKELGVGSGAVRTIAGTLKIHQELEEKLAKFKHTEAALVFQSGFTCNMGVIEPLLSKEDVIISDEFNHASIIDGIRLSKAARKIFKHSDMESLEEQLKASNSYRLKLIITDGVFSMDGDIAKLPEIVDLAEKYDAFVMVDDAHSSGVLGSNGRGSVDHFKLNGRVDIQVGTLSKAVGVLGGYIAGSRRLIDFLRHKGRPFLFSTSHPPGVVAANIAAIDVLLEEPELIDKLWENTRYFKNALDQFGFNTGKSETPIIPIIVGEGALAMSLSDALLEEGVFCTGIGFPTVPQDKSRVRTIVTATHTKADLDRAVEAFAKVGRKLELF
ncbi:MAG: 8-amino-7-oxononanoate synthase [Desulfitibacter sp. BRH_c19]|nr:MAG: 8-amino-7-oxononanoate synthase [Desulfitibacter sp. BRH_c19]